MFKDIWWYVWCYFTVRRTVVIARLRRAITGSYRSYGANLPAAVVTIRGPHLCVLLDRTTHEYNQQRTWSRLFGCLPLWHVYGWPIQEEPWVATNSLVLIYDLGTSWRQWDYHFVDKPTRLRKGEVTHGVCGGPAVVMYIQNNVTPIYIANINWPEQLRERQQIVR
jgi:hypothetical protein